LKVPADPQVLASIEIRPAASGAPEAFFQNKPAAATVSLSHRAGIAACAVACSSGVLGCDIETIEQRSDAFVADYFTTEEQSFVAEASAVDRLRLLALLWSAKESALKALHEGLRLDARNVIVSPGDAEFDFDCWNPIVVRHSYRRVFCGWWRHADRIVRTLVAAPAPNPPIRLRIPECVPDAASLRP
jgi:4'-phosphopantetheinyl transferase